MGSNPAIPTIRFVAAGRLERGLPLLDCGVGVLENVLRAIGFGLCHQLPERSLFAGGVQLPVCARDTGIYVGFVVSVALVVLLHRPRRPSGFPSRAGWAVIALLIGSMALDGVTEYAGLRETTNIARVVTGTAAGFAVAAVIVPLLFGELFAERDPDRVLTPEWRLVAWALAMPVTAAAVWFGPVLGVSYAVIVTVAIFATFIAVNMVFAALLPPFDRQAHRLVDLAWPAVFGFVLTLFEFLVASMLRIGFALAAARLLGS